MHYGTFNFFKFSAYFVKLVASLCARTAALRDWFFHCVYNNSFVVVDICQKQVCTGSSTKRYFFLNHSISGHKLFKKWQDFKYFAQTLGY